MALLKSLWLSPLLLALVGGAAAGQSDVRSVLGVVVGDTACHLTLITEDEEIVGEWATFDVCDRALVGTRIRPSYTSAQLPADSCAGDPDCGETQTVSLISRLNVLPEPALATVRSVSSGDRACYLELVDTADTVYVQFADYGLCQPDLVGERVRLNYVTGNVRAFDCQGNVVCDRTEPARLITTAIPLERYPTVESLPDGSYRYWSVRPEDVTVTDDTLLANPESMLFHFRKAGSQVTGVFSYIDGEAICVQGQVTGNTVAGMAVQDLLGATVISDADEFVYFGPSTHLAVRRGRQLDPGTVRYGGALLNLNGMHRINAGGVAPLRRC